MAEDSWDDDEDYDAWDNADWDDNEPLVKLGWWDMLQMKIRQFLHPNATYGAEAWVKMNKEHMFGVLSMYGYDDKK